MPVGFRWRRAWVLIPGSLVCIAGLAGGAAIGRRLAADRPVPMGADDYAFFNEIVEVRHLLSKRFVDAPDQAKLRHGAIQGMVEALDDPYTLYVPAADTKAFNKDLLGEYVGIGAQVNIQEGYLVIVSPLEDSPAFRAGLMGEDRVVEIDGKSTLNMPMDECIKLLMGEPGTTVKLTIDRKGERLPIDIVRDRIKTRAVKGVRRDGTDPNAWDFTIDPSRGIAYIRLTQFLPGCADEVAAALRRAGAESGTLKGLVLDVRFNPGGLLNEAEKIADLFLESGVIVSTRGRAYPEVVRNAAKPGTLPNFPIVILVNGQSASASEVLAGALAENDRAVVVGSRTFGKGSVQSVVELSSGLGSELKITEQGYYLPSGRSITRRDDSPTWGVDPSEGFYVPMTDDELIAMIGVRRKNELLSAEGQVPVEGENWADPEWVLESLKDSQLAAGVHALQSRIDTGEWKKTGSQLPTQAAAAGDELSRLDDYQRRLLRELEKTERRIDAVESTGAAVVNADKDLWADDLDLRGGVLEIKDKDGKVVSRLDITGNSLERWLLDADVKKQAEEPAKPD